MFTTSGVSVRGRAYWGAYAASKFALEGLMQVLADETDTLTKIRVNSVNPGKVRTAMRARAYPGEDAATVPLPAVVLPTYLYLLGPRAPGVTGRRFDAQSFAGRAGARAGRDLGRASDRPTREHAAHRVPRRRARANGRAAGRAAASPGPTAPASCG